MTSRGALQDRLDGAPEQAAKAHAFGDEVPGPRAPLCPPAKFSNSTAEALRFLDMIEPAHRWIDWRQPEPRENLIVSLILRRRDSVVFRPKRANESAFVGREICLGQFDPCSPVEHTPSPSPFRRLLDNSHLDVSALSDIDDDVLGDKKIDADETRAKRRRIGPEMRREHVERVHEAFALRIAFVLSLYRSTTLLPSTAASVSISSARNCVCP